MDKVKQEKKYNIFLALTVRLLVASTGTGTSELERNKVISIGVMKLEIKQCVINTDLLGFAATGIGNKKGTIELDKDFLDLLLGGLIDKLLVEGNNSLGKSLTDSVDLRGVT
jgi:hypothetical protein